MITGPHIYRNIDDGEILIIPSGRNDKGWSSAIDQPIWLDYSSTLNDIGKAVRMAIEICEKSPIIHCKYPTIKEQKDGDMVLLRETNCKKIKDVGKIYESVSIRNMPGGELNLPSTITDRGIVVSALYFQGGGYWGYSDFPHRDLDFDCSDKDLGQAIIDMFEAVKTIVNKH